MKIFFLFLIVSLDQYVLLSLKRYQQKKNFV